MEWKGKVEMEIEKKSDEKRKEEMEGEIVRCEKIDMWWEGEGED